MMHAESRPHLMRHLNDSLRPLAQILLDETAIEFAVLVGSRAAGHPRAGSDWDIALQWVPQSDSFAVWGKTEILRKRIAEVLGVIPDQVDLIDLRRANLAMRASVAEEGILLKGENTLAWPFFLRRTWRELEDFYWEKQHAV
jgi:predicted nucleotidyltransferase